MNFNGKCLINDITTTPKKVGPQLRSLNTSFALDNCLFGSVKLTMNANLDKYKYNGYGIGLDSRLEFYFTDQSYGKNVINFGADASLSVHVDNKGKYISIRGEIPTQGLDDMTLTAEGKYPINFTQSGGRFVLNLHNNGRKDFWFVNATKVYQLK